MGQEVTIGGERLGSGKKMKAYLHGYERSTHNIGYTWKSTMAAGTLVPFMVELALPGTTMDIDLDVDVMTHPTEGPLFGSFKVQLDVFQIPLRLYQAKLHMNMLKIGLNMSQVYLPQIKMTADGQITPSQPIDNQQINSSCIFSYLNMRGLGTSLDNIDEQIVRSFHASSYLGYWDIYKNYYANKQEEIGAVIHKELGVAAPVITTAVFSNSVQGNVDLNAVPGEYAITFYPDSVLYITATGITNNTQEEQFIMTLMTYFDGNPYQSYDITKIWDTIIIDPDTGAVYCSNPANATIPGIGPILNGGTNSKEVTAIAGNDTDINGIPEIVTFPLENIDTMRQNILSYFANAPYEITDASDAPYGLPLKWTGAGFPKKYSKQFSQEGLGLKTYNSDLFNNWIQTEWIDGVNGIADVTAVQVVGGEFTIDELNLKNKIYNMLNRIAISDGTYDAWQDATYDHQRIRSAENPMYIGGLIDELVFQEVVSNSATDTQPLGTLAGRGRILGRNKGGKIIAKVDEPSIIMGIVSLTPRLDYSQGNKWDTTLSTMNDLHKPALDEIGFQDLITDQMAWWDTKLDGGLGIPTYKSAGKQPAWINYMTNVNQVRGNFGDPANEGWMVLNRDYRLGYDGDGKPEIADLTTYIDPTKFNKIFAYGKRDAQNFWVQIGIKNDARRKMSAKIMPNL